MQLIFLLGSAWASSVYPEQVQADVGGDCTPMCTICHATNGGGDGTITQPFGEALVSRGLVGGANTASVTDALTQLSEDGVDSDGDGTLDVDELAMGADPNPGGLAFCDVLLPTYGCLSTVGGPALRLGAVAGLVALARRRRRREAPG